MGIAGTSVTIHMVASLDGFIARRDGSVDWLETADTFDRGETLEPDQVARFLATIDCYVLGSRPTKPRSGSRREASDGRTATRPRSS